jgi:predicted ATPase
MISHFGLQNFKAIKNFQELEIRPVTVLMGENSSGKSSLLQAISLLTVNQMYGNDIRRIKYSNPFSNLGDGDTFKNHGEKLILKFGLQEDDAISTNITLEYQDDANDWAYGLLEKINIVRENYFNAIIHYVPTQANYQIKLEYLNIRNKQFKFLTNIYRDVTINTNLKLVEDFTYPTETTANHFKEISELGAIILKPLNILISNLTAVRHLGNIKEVKSSYDYPNDYVGYFGESYKEVAKQLKNTRFLRQAVRDVFNYEIKEIEKDTGNIFLNIADKALKLALFGSSISSTMPLLTQLAKIRENSNYMLTMVEEPEINLHPKSQAKIANYLFAKRKSKKHYIVVETHSDHIVNKLRHLVLQKHLPAKDVVLYYKDRTTEDFHKITLDSKGSFISAEYNNQFPKGFFDATLSEVMELNLHG